MPAPAIQAASRGPARSPHSRRTDPEESVPSTMPAPPPGGADAPGYRLPDFAVRPPPNLYAEAILAARELERAEPRAAFESLPPSSAPLRVAPSFTVAVLEMERDARRAELALRGVLSRAPNLAEAHYHLGVLRLRRGDIVVARRYLENAAAALRRAVGPEPPWAASMRALLSDLG